MSHWALLLVTALKVHINLFIFTLHIFSHLLPDSYFAFESYTIAFINSDDETVHILCANSL